MPPAPGVLDLEFWRSEFPVHAEIVYLNHASESPLPRRAREALVAALRKNASPHTETLDDFFGLPGRCRALAARIVGADPREIALTPSATYGINTAAHGLPLEPGDEVVLFEGEFPANYYPWWNACARRGLALRVVPRVPGGPERDSFPTAGRVREALGPRTRLLALSLVSFTTGFRAPVEEIGALCRERGVFFVLDAAQAAGALPLEVERIGADVLAVSGHKWLLSPAGTGFLFVRSGLLETLRPTWTGWMPFQEGGFAGLTRYHESFPPDARRYETGTPPIAELAAFESSLALLLETGIAAIGGRLRALGAAFAEEAAQGGWEVAGPWGEEEPAASGIVAVRRKGTPGSAGLRALRRSGFYAVVREEWLRVSPHLHVSEEEIREAGRVLSRL